MGAPNTSFPALVNKQVDAVMAFEPMGGFCEVLKVCRMLVNPNEGEGPPDLLAAAGAGSLLIARKEWIQKKPQALAAFSAAKVSHARARQLVPRATALDNAAFGLKMHGTPAEQRRGAARKMLARVGLGGFENAYPKALSQGMRERVALARTFALEAELLLMDEPFGALDAQTKLQLQDLLLSLCQESRRSADAASRRGARLKQALAYLGRTFNVNGVMALLLVLAMLGVAVVRSMTWLERRLLHWQ